MRTLAIGDIHGNIKALKQCLDRSKFDYDNDRLISLGDTCDGWRYVKECFDELLKVKDLVHIMGNHDLWAISWFDRKDYNASYNDTPKWIWYSQGGKETIASYDGKQMDEAHMKILRKAPFYYIQDNMVFVHGGFYENSPVEIQPFDVLTWDRGLFKRACMVHGCNPDYKIQEWDTVFIGHTQTSSKTDGFEPKFYCNLINLDQGAGWDGKLTIMDIHTKEFWQSDLSHELYPDEKGR